MRVPPWISTCLAALLGLLAGCAGDGVPQGVPPESDAGVVLDETRDAVVAVEGRLVRVTDLPGAEELEVLSPDGRWVAFVADHTGLASVWATQVPAEGQAPRAPIQLTNVGLERAPRVKGQAPRGFVPVPDHDRGLSWSDPRTITWTAAGQRYTVELPR